MANLTWRDVAAPDFSGALQGLKTFNDLLSTGLGQAGATVRGLDEAKSNAVNQQFALRLAQEQDPAALQAKIASGEILAGVPAQRLNSASIAALSARPGDLIKQASDRANLETTNLNMAQRKAMDANAGIWNKALSMVNSGKTQSEIEAYLGEHPEAFQGIGYNNLKSIHEDVASGRDKFLNNDQSAFNLSTSKEDRANEALVADVFTKIRAGALNGEQARAQLYDPKGPAASLNPRARASLEARLSNEYPDLFGTGGGGTPAGGAIAAAAGGGTGGAGYNRIVGDVVQPPKPVTSMTISELKNFGDTVVIPATRAMSPAKRAQLGLTGNLGSSAMGQYQIIGDTAIRYAKKLGLDPNTTVFTPEVQDRLAEAIFNDAKGGNLKAVFASVPNATPGAYKNASWADMREFIARGEGGGNPLLTNAAAQTRLAARNMQNNAQGIAADIAGTLGDTRDVGSVADELRAGPFKGTSRAYLVDQINSIMARAPGTNAATAAAILKRNVQGKDHPILSTKDFWNRLLKDNSPNLGNGIRIMKDGVERDIAELKTGRVYDRVDVNQQAQVDMGQLQVAQQQLSAAQAEYQDVLRQLPTRPALQQTALPLALAKVQAAQLAVQRLTQQAAMSQRMNPQVASN